MDVNKNTSVRKPLHYSNLLIMFIEINFLIAMNSACKELITQREMRFESYI